MLVVEGDETSVVVVVLVVVVVVLLDPGGTPAASWAPASQMYRSLPMETWWAVREDGRSTGRYGNVGGRVTSEEEQR